jgi:hypothetical protein
VFGVTLTDGVDARVGTSRSADDPRGGNSQSALPEHHASHLGKLREFARLAAADARLAAEEGDSARAEADLVALVSFARHAKEVPSLICQLVGIAVLALQVDTVGYLLELYPGLLDDAQLERISNCIAAYPGDGPLALSLAGEEDFIDDLLQRAYSDDGAGDGRLCYEGLRNWERMMRGGTTSASFGSIFLRRSTHCDSRAVKR